MAYLYIKQKGGQKYYYLRASFKKRKKSVTKDIKYLGKDIKKINIHEMENNPSFDPVRKKIIRIKFLEEAKKKKRKENKYLNFSQICEINSVLASYAKLKLANKENMLKNYRIDFITNNILMESDETNILEKKEIKKIMEKNGQPKKMGTIQIKYTINTENIFKFLKKEHPHLNSKLIILIHDYLVENFLRDCGIRTEEIKMAEKSLKPTKIKNIESELKQLLSWYNAQKNKIHPLALIILFHHKFEKIHPFRGLNGQTGRIIMNYMLEQKGYPPLIIKRKDRDKYHSVMNKAYPCLKKDLLSTDMRYYKPLMDFMQKQFVKTYWGNFIV